MSQGSLSIIVGALMGAILLGSLANCTESPTVTGMPTAERLIGIDRTDPFHDAVGVSSRSHTP